MSAVCQSSHGLSSHLAERDFIERMLHLGLRLKLSDLVCFLHGLVLYVTAHEILYFRLVVGFDTGELIANLQAIITTLSTSKNVQ